MACDFEIGTLCAQQPTVGRVYKTYVHERHFDATRVDHVRLIQFQRAQILVGNSDVLFHQIVRDRRTVHDAELERFRQADEMIGMVMREKVSRVLGVLETKPVDDKISVWNLHGTHTDSANRTTNHSETQRSCCRLPFCSLEYPLD